jgi:glycosyltransferase involved in cell wall biosynthesis
LNLSGGLRPPATVSQLSGCFNLLTSALMRIVFLNPSGQIGGAEAALLEVLSSLRAAAPLWDLHLIASAGGPFVEKAKALGVSTVVLPFPASMSRLGDSAAVGRTGRRTRKRKILRALFQASPDIARYTWQLRKALRELAPDVIHTNGFKMHLLGALAKPRRAKLVWHIHDYVRARPLMSKAMCLLSNRCSIALTNSQSVAADLSAICKRLRVRTIYNAVDTKVFSPRGAQADLDVLSGLEPVIGSTVRIGLLATLARWKGHETFLRAFSLLPETLSLRGYIVGGALYQTEGSQSSLAGLKTLAGDLGIADRVGFTGFVDQPASAMRSLDILVHASTQPEPFGLVIAEGMACGRAVIASNAGGAAEVFDADVNALGHAPGDVVALAQRMEELIAKPELRARLGAAGRATAEARFDRARLARELVPIYREVIAGRRTAKGKSQRAKCDAQSASSVLDS